MIHVSRQPGPGRRLKIECPGRKYYYETVHICPPRKKKSSWKRPRPIPPPGARKRFCWSMARGIVTGKVRLDYARDRHSLWTDDLEPAAMTIPETSDTAPEAVLEAPSASLRAVPAKDQEKPKAIEDLPAQKTDSTEGT